MGLGRLGTGPLFSLFSRSSIVFGVIILWVKDFGQWLEVTGFGAAFDNVSSP